MVRYLEHRTLDNLLKHLLFRLWIRYPNTYGNIVFHIVVFSQAYIKILSNSFTFKKMNLKLYLKTKEKGICAKPLTSLQVLAKFMNFLKKNSTDICV